MVLNERHGADPLSSIDLHVWIPFEVNEHLKGGIGLGEKLTGDAYTPDDSELLVTLANQAAIAIRNAKAHEEVELYFGAFLDEILKYGGDVNETAADGLMVIFRDPDPRRHAASAVQAALAILRKTRETNATLEGFYEPITMPSA